MPVYKMQVSETEGNGLLFTLLYQKLCMERIKLIAVENDHYIIDNDKKIALEVRKKKIEAIENIFKLYGVKIPSPVIDLDAPIEKVSA